MVVPLAVLVLGIAVTLFGALWDRRKRHRALAELTSPPDREIPGHAPAAKPHYLLGELAHRRTTPLPPHEPTRAEHEGTVLPYGFASPEFRTDSTHAVRDDARVLVCRSITSMTDLLPLFDGNTLVILTEEISDEVLATLAVNVVQDKLALVVVVTGDPLTDDELAELGTTVVDATDLQAGYVPATSFGHATQWVSTADRSWALSH